MRRSTKIALIGMALFTVPMMTDINWFFAMIMTMIGIPVALVGIVGRVAEVGFDQES